MNQEQQNNKFPRLFKYLVVVVFCIVLIVLIFQQNKTGTHLMISIANSAWVKFNYSSRYNIFDFVERNENKTEYHSLNISMKAGGSHQPNVTSATSTLSGKSKLVDLASSTQTIASVINYESPVILFYTPFFSVKPWPYFHKIPNYSEYCGCNFNRCEITYNKNDFSKADAIIFHGRDMPKLDVLSNLNRSRKQNQLWMYFIKENPFNAPSVQPLNQFFDLAMTYRRNSDFSHPYGNYTKAKFNTTKKHIFDIAKIKSKQIAWMVSHCNTKRDKLAYIFEAYGLQIHVGGGCKHKFKNKINCATRQCIKEMQKYKFYFAAENNFCNDYITEKYWVNPFKIIAVPIVLGGANYSDLAIPGSYIDAFDFKSPRELVEYIKMVDTNDTLYNSYFMWKKHYEIYSEKHVGCSKTMCEICDRMKNGIKKRLGVLANTISRKSECDQKENYFDRWINS